MFFNIYIKLFKKWSILSYYCFSLVATYKLKKALPITARLKVRECAVQQDQIWILTWCLTKINHTTSPLKIHWKKAIPKSQGVFKGDNGQQAVYNGDKTYRYGEQVYYNRDKDSVWWSQRFRGNIYIAEKKPTIDWQLKKETKKIGNLVAHKATGKFRGREYTAWYTLEIPLPYGPWKLQGLPGLILEAYDEKKEMYLYFKNVEYPTNNKAKISQVKRAEQDPRGWQSIEEYEDMLRKSLTKAYNGMVLRAEKNRSEKPEKPVFSEIYIESFEWKYQKGRVYLLGFSYSV